MGYVIYKTKEHVYTGPSDGISAEEIISPNNFVSTEEQQFYQTNTPFSITLTTIAPDSDMPYRLTVISPGYFLHTELDRNEYKKNVHGRSQHMHNTYEIEYTRSGEFYQQIEARRYKYAARSCCLLNRNIRHKEEYDTAFSTVILSLSYEFLRNLFNDPLDQWFPDADVSWKESEELKKFFDIELRADSEKRKSFLNFTPVYDVKEEEDPIHGCFDRITQIALAPPPGSSHLFRSEICRLLAQLSDESRYSTALFNLGTETESRIFSAVTHLTELSHGRITRAELSKQLNYSGNYLNRITLKYSGMNLSQYGNYFAMQQASRLLLGSDRTISEICAELGFSDRTHFYELFRAEFGMTPKEYRKR